MSFQVRTRADDADKHSADVNALLFYKGKLYSGGDDGKIVVWEADLTKIAETKAHDAAVYSLAASEDTLYSASNDGTIKAWKLDNLESKGTIVKEEEDVEFWIVIYTNGSLYSSDNQGLVRIHKGNEASRFYSQLEQLKGLIVQGNVLYGSRDLDVVITEVTGSEDNFNVRATLTGRAPITLAGDKLVFSSRSGKDILVNENSQELHYKQFAEVKDAHDLVINSLVGTKSGSETFIYSAGWDKTVKQWKITNEGVTPVNSAKADIVVNILALGEPGSVYAGGSDGHIIRIDV